MERFLISAHPSQERMKGNEFPTKVEASKAAIESISEKYFYPTGEIIDGQEVFKQLNRDDLSVFRCDQKNYGWYVLVKVKSQEIRATTFLAVLFNNGEIETIPST